MRARVSASVVPTCGPHASPTLLCRWCQHIAGLDFVPTLPVLAAHLQVGALNESPPMLHGCVAIVMDASQFICMSDQVHKYMLRHPVLAAHLQEQQRGHVLEGLGVYRQQQRVAVVAQRLWDLKQGEMRLGWVGVCC